MKIKNILAGISFFIAGMFLVGCESYLDINDDPNNPLDVPVNQLLPSIQVDIAGALGMSSGGLSQITSSYMHQIVQRGSNINDYGVTGDDFGVSTPWNVFYTRALKDVDIMIEQGTTEEALHYVAIGQILKAYSATILVDVYGDVPYFEALQGIENLNPSYDDGEMVYDDALTLLDQAIANIAATSTKAPGSDDLIFGGNMATWRKLANSVKLKLYNQMRLVRNVTTEVDALLAAGDLLDATSGDFELAYGGSAAPDDRNPGWVQEIGGANPQYYVSPFFFETMAKLNTFGHRNYGGDLGPVADPRMAYYFFHQMPQDSIDAYGNDYAENPCSYCPTRTGTGFLTIWQFSFNIDPNEGFDQATSQTILGEYAIGAPFDDLTGTVGNGPLGPNFGNPSAAQRMLTAFAVKYTEAELRLTGAASGGTAGARTAFEEALNLSFAKVNSVTAGTTIVQADIDAYVTDVLTAFDAATAAGQLEHIMTQKWIASYGFGVDSYTDYRRTGFPVLHDGNTDNLTTTVRTRDYPNSFPWVTTNLAINSSAPAQKIVTSDAAKPFWMQ